MSIAANDQFGAYEVLSRLGAGGMGEVWRARDTRLDREVAIKVLNASFAGDAERLRRFEHEARAISALNHPNIITIHEIGKHEDTHFIVTEFIEGKTLRQKIEGRRLPLAEALEIASQVASALVAAHEAGIIHRDIKPDNIMVRPDGYVKVLDFGIAKLANPQSQPLRSQYETLVDDNQQTQEIRTQTGALIGTPRYMSPEQARGQRIDARTDIFSLGAVIYEMVAGRPAFSASTPVDAIVQVLQTMPEPLTEIVKGIPQELDRIVSKAMSKESERRYKTIIELLTDLRRLKEGIEFPEKRFGVSAAGFSTEVASSEKDYKTTPASTIVLSSSPPNNLPAQLTSLIGRESELQSIEQLLRKENLRLLTLTGPGGTGKTRLSIQVAANLLESFGDGVFFISLAPITDPNLVCSEITKTLEVQESASTLLTETLKRFLRARQMLLVLDNFEQVLDAAPFVADLLQSCPRLKIIVTSRALLQIRGEREFAVEPLALPDVNHSQLPDQVRGYSAVALFADRARLANPAFTITEENASDLAELCIRLDGLPLAIELAAARIKMLSPKNLLMRLDNRLNLLVSGARDLPARQQTIRNTIKWSYDLLDDQEKRLFRWLSVFVGGFTFDHAEWLCKAMPDCRLDVLDGITSLVNKSLLKQQDRLDEQPRFTMLETIKEYGLEQLLATGEAETVKGLHSEYFLQMAEMAESELLGKTQQDWLERLDAEHDNMRAALNWTQGSGDTETGLRIAGALWRYWLIRTHWSEGRERLTRLLQSDGDCADPDARVKALTGLATLAQNQSDYELARSLFEKCLAICRASENRSGIATSLVNLGWIAFHQCDYDVAHALSEEGLALHTEAGNQQGIILAINNLGFIAFYQGGYEVAASLHQKNVRLRKEASDNRGLTFSLVHLARASLRLNDYGKAGECIEEAISLIEAVGDKQGIAYALTIKGELLNAEGDSERAMLVAERGMKLWREIGDRYGLSFGLIVIARIASANGDYQQATDLYQESLALQKDSRNRRDIAECFEQLAAISVRHKQFKRGAALLSASTFLREGIGFQLSPQEVASQSATIDEMKAALGEDEFRDSCARARELSLEQMMAFAMNEDAEI